MAALAFGLASFTASAQTGPHCATDGSGAAAVDGSNVVVPATGPFRALIVFVRFADDTRTSTCHTYGWPNPTPLPDDAADFIAATEFGSRPPRSISKFFFDQTGGNFRMYGNVIDYETTGPELDYLNAPDRGFRSLDLARVAREAMDSLQANRSVNFAQYDANVDGYLDHVFFVIRGYSQQSYCTIGVFPNSNGTYGCPRGGISGIGFSESTPARYGIKVDSGLSGSFNDWFPIDPFYDNVALWAHEFGHDIWGSGHLPYYRGNGVPARPENQGAQSGYGTMMSTDETSRRFYEQSALISVFEREAIDLRYGLTGSAQWARCTDLTASGTFTLSNLFTGGGCYRLGLGTLTTAPMPNGRGDQFLYLSNLQRTPAFPFSLATTPPSVTGNGCQSLDWGLEATGLMVERGAFQGSGMTLSRSRDVVPADNAFLRFDPPGILASVPPTLDEHFGGDFWRPGMDRQLTPWTTPNVYGYGTLAVVPAIVYGTGRHAIDDIRSGSGTDIVFDYHPNVNQRPVAYVRENWVVGGDAANAGLTFNELRILSGTTLAITATTPITFNGNLVVEAGGVLTVAPGATLRFAPGKGILNYGTFTSTGATLTAVSPGSGWDGFTNYDGGTATLAAGTVVERVGGALYGSGAVRVFGGVLTLDNSRIENPASTGVIYGLKVSGGFAAVKSDSRILGHSAGGILATNNGFVNLYTSEVRSLGEGLRASDSDIWVSNSSVTNNATWGASADATGFISFLGQIAGQPTIEPGSENTVFTANVTGDLQASYGGFTGGASTSYRRNSFWATNGGTQARIENGSSAVLEFNWWGQATGPDPARVFTTGKSVFDGCPWITSPGGSTPGGGSCSVSAPARGATGDGTANVEGEGTPDVLDPAMDALAVADAAGVFAAVGAALDSGADSDSTVVARALPLVLAGLRLDVLPEGVALLEQLAGAGGAARSGDGNHASSLVARVQTLATLRTDRAAGIAAAQALTADAATAPSGHAVLALAALRAGDTAGALAAAEAATRGLDARHAPDDAAFVAAVRADVNAAVPGAPGLAEAESFRLPDETPTAGDGRLTLGVARPNPTTGLTTIDLTLAAAASVDAGVFDVLGRRVATLAEGTQEAGRMSLAFDASRMPAGVYVVRVVVRSGGQADTLARRVTVTR